MLDVTILLCRGGCVSTSIVPLEIFHAAGVIWNMCIGRGPEPLFRTTTVTVDGRPVEGMGPIHVVPDKALEEVTRTDLIFVPTPGFDLDVLLAENAASVPWLKRLHERGALIAGVCTGVALLAEAGILDGRRATTHWAMADAFRARYPRVEWQPQQCVTEDQGVFCGGGLYSSIDLALYLVEKLCGRNVAIEIVKALVLQMPRTYQTSFAVLPIGRDHGDPVIRRAEDWLHNHLADEINFDELAARFGLTTRTLQRRFKAATAESPRAYLQHLRVQAAKGMLEADRMTVQEISVAVGYDDATFFRDLFKRHAGLSPGAYRDRFGRAMQPIAA
jgi:transcriptional regulator GlxA family with amidase domain